MAVGGSVHQRPDCHWRPWCCSGLGYRFMALLNCSLCWCLWLLLPSRAVKMSEVWATRCGHMVNKVHATTGAMPIWVGCVAIQSNGFVHVWSAVKGHVWVFGPTVARLCVNTQGSCYHSMLCRYPGSELAAEAMLVPEGHTATRAIQIGVACATTQRHVNL